MAMVCKRCLDGGFAGRHCLVSVGTFGGRPAHPLLPGVHDCDGPWQYWVAVQVSKLEMELRFFFFELGFCTQKWCKGGSSSQNLRRIYLLFAFGHIVLIS